MTALAIAPQVYYDAATTLNNAAAAFYTEIDGKWADLSSNGAAMAGTYEEARKWATSYDDRAFEVLNTARGVAEAVDAYATVLRQMGHNHAIAEYNATMRDSATAPAPPGEPAGAGFYVCKVPLPSAGGSTNGLVDDGVVKIAEAVGITIPNGDTTKLETTAGIWTQIQSLPAVANLVPELDRAAQMFAEITSPETDVIDADFTQLKNAATTLIAAFGELSTSLREHKSDLDTLREELVRELAKMGQDIVEELAKEIVISVAIGVLASTVTFGIGALVASGRIAHIVAKFAVPIGRLANAFKAGRIARGVSKGQDLAPHNLNLREIAKLRDKTKTPGTNGKKPSGSGAPTQLSQREIDEIADYTGSTHQKLNGELRSGEVTPATQQRVDTLNSALDKMPDYRGGVTRVTDLPPEVLAKYKEGGSVTEDAFTSTSPLANGGGVRSGQVEMQIFSKTGKDITEHSAPGNPEVLFRSGTEFNVTKRYYDWNTGRTVIQMIEK
ncbi:ADP-ribosyltransferase [Nocardia sp. FBN12]|uniref:ADP-ribosyltransferase n=1 Tax=Nocardia sp. FBN12 TaxID=3419766 RepID=UPI003D04D3B3